MDRPHPLDRPVWEALSGRQAGISRGGPLARAMATDHGPFAASADRSPESLAALAAIAPPAGGFWLVEAEPAPPPPGMMEVRRATCVQMVAAALTPAADASFVFAPLTEEDGPAMLALATLTRPGPFAARTHQLGAFVGVKVDGLLVAMAGERMRPAGYTEVSGVCTHPDHRGRGYAGGLMRRVASRILARGETPFLHAYAANTAAVALYESLGFSVRREVTMMVVDRV